MIWRTTSYLPYAEPPLQAHFVRSKTRSYDYFLPEDLIAQNPVIPRDISRLLVVQAQNADHQSFNDLPSFLKPGDLLVMNNSQVIPARLLGYKLNPESPEHLDVKLKHYS